MEEVRTYFLIVFFATFAIAINILSLCKDFGQALLHAFFQVTSISSTTGLSTVNFDTWPAFSQAILMVLTIIGACGGSTGGGFKVARMGILVKSTAADFRRLINPRAVIRSKYDGEYLDSETVRNVKTYFLLWVIIVILSTLILSLDFQGTAVFDGLYTNFSATLASIGNVGPGFDAVGPIMNYSFYSPFSKCLLSLVMLIGRLEIFPMIILFAPRTWKRA